MAQTKSLMGFVVVVLGLAIIGWVLPVTTSTTTSTNTTFDIIANYTDLNATGERLYNTLYFSNDTARILYVMINSTPPEDDYDVNVYVNDTLLCSQDHRETLEVTSTTCTVLIPRWSNYTVIYEPSVSSTVYWYEHNISSSNGTAGPPGAPGASFTLNVTGQPAISNFSTLINASNISLTQSGNTIIIDTNGSLGVTDHSQLTNLNITSSGHLINGDMHFAGNDIHGVKNFNFTEDSYFNWTGTAGTAKPQWFFGGTPLMQRNLNLGFDLSSSQGSMVLGVKNNPAVVDGGGTGLVLYARDGNDTLTFIGRIENVWYNKGQQYAELNLIAKGGTGDPWATTKIMSIRGDGTINLPTLQSSGGNQFVCAYPNKSIYFSPSSCV